MPYGEKLKMIKKARGLTDSAIHKICDVPLPTVTRVFNEKNLSGNFETFVALAKGLGFSLDELAGLKPPTESPSVELLRDKDIKIERLTEDNKILREDNKNLREDNHNLRIDNKTLRREKIKIIVVLVVLLIALTTWCIIDLTNGHFGIFRY